MDEETSIVSVDPVRLVDGHRLYIEQWGHSAHVRSLCCNSQLRLHPGYYDCSSCDTFIRRPPYATARSFNLRKGTELQFEDWVSSWTGLDIEAKFELG